MFCGGCGARLPVATGKLSPLPSIQVSGLPKPSAASGVKTQTTPSMEAERRNVTVLFADISGFTAMSELLDPEEVTKIMNGCLKIMADSVMKYEGYVDKFIGDCIMAIFGAPVAHENDPELAILAALEMKKEVEEYNRNLPVKLEKPLTMHIGINTGMVIAGGVGSDQKMEYTVMGDTVNLASRLESNAGSGQIFVSEYTYNGTRNHFEFINHESITVKGKRKPVAVYEAVKAKSYREQGGKKTEAASPLVGRGPEMEILNTCLDKLAAGTGQAVFLISDAGVGKSRILYEAKKHPQKEKIQILEGICRSFNSATCYYIFSEFFKNLFNVDPEDLPETTALKITKNLPLLLGLDPEALPSEGREAIVFIAAILGLKIGDDYDIHLAQMEAQEIKAATFRSIAWFFGQLARKKPLILIMEDLHYSDSTSVELIAYLLGQLKKMPVMLLLLMRQQKEHPSSKLPLIAKQSLNGRCSEIVFNRLTHEECVELTRRLFKAEIIPDAVLDLIQSRADGNPLFIEEIVRNLLEEKVVEKTEDGEIRIIKDLLQVAIPDSINGIITARIDKLQSHLRDILQTAAVIGPVFELQLISRIIKQNDLEERINKLVEMELIFESRSFPEIEYSFRNVLIKEAVYSCLLRQKQKELHGLVAREIESLYENRLEDQYEVLARHYQEADDPARAYSYLFKNGMKAKEAYANQDAVEFFNRAIQIGQELKTPSVPLEDIFKVLSEVQELMGQMDAAIESRSKAFELMDSDLKKGDAMRNIGRLHEKGGDKEKAMEVYEEACEILKDHPQSTEMGVLAMNQSWVLNRMKKVDEAIHKGFDALKILEANGAAEDTAQMYNNLSVFFEHKGDLPQALEYNLKSLKIFTEQKNQRKTANIFLSLGYLENKRNNLESALDYFDKSLEIMDKIGNRFGAATALMSKGRCYIDSGRLDESEHALLQSLRIHKELDLKKKIVANELALGKVYMEKGETVSAREHLEGARQTASQNDYGSDLAKALHMEARLLIKEGKAPEEKFQEALELYKSLGRNREADSVAKELEDCLAKECQEA